MSVGEADPHRWEIGEAASLGGLKKAVQDKLLG